MICVPVTGKGEAALEEFRQAQKAADIVELRLDLIGQCDLKRIAHAKKKPVIVTCRPKSQGGNYLGSDKHRFGILMDAIEFLGAEFVDVELGTPRKVTKSLLGCCAKGAIISYHDFKKTPKDLLRIYRRIAASGANVVKIAVMANSINDNLKAFEVLSAAESEDRKAVVFCMGPLGSISRILYRKFGGFMTYASLAQGKEAAPGQLTAAEMRGVYRADRLSAETKLLGVVGSPEKHSSSPYMFNAAYKALNINAVHVKFPVKDVGSFVKGFRPLVYGLAVTIPHKETIIPFLDELDGTARAIGAVNTVVKLGNGRLKGYNTDLIGGMNALKKKTMVRGREVVIHGAGGAARAMAYGIAKEGGKLTILNRTLGKAEELAKKYGCSHGGLDKLGKIKYDILINCTSLGMKGELPVGTNLLRQGTTVMDLVYLKRGETRLVEEAEAKGCITVSGREVLVLQALDQFRMWTGKKAPEKVMREALKNADA